MLLLLLLLLGRHHAAGSGALHLPGQGRGVGDKIAEAAIQASRLRGRC